MTLFPCPCAACGVNFTEDNFARALFIEARSSTTGLVERKGPFHEGCALQGHKVFKFKHLIFGDEETRREGDMPRWLEDWFREQFVLTLAVGAHVDTDYWRIERTA